MKIYVYAIAKDEEKFVERFMDSVKDADGVYVLDTGSTDKTLDRFKEWADRNKWHSFIESPLDYMPYGSIVEGYGEVKRGCPVGATGDAYGVDYTDKRIVIHGQIINPWRFDVARNRSLAMVPEDADVCICLDLDEELQPGWRDAIEKQWDPDDTTRAHYRYVWNFNPDGSEGTVFLSEKIHARHGFEWIYPVHEVLRYNGIESHINIDGLQIHHHADNSKPRSSYLPLLEISAQENPNDDRIAHYLGREYYFNVQYEKAITELNRHLSLPAAIWDAERSASMRYIAKCEVALGNYNQAELWLYRAIDEAPQYREPYTDMAELMYNRGEWTSVVRFADKALKITERELSYITEPKAWGSFLWDILSIAWWNLGEHGYASNCARKALEFEQDNDRIQKNLELMMSVA